MAEDARWHLGKRVVEVKKGKRKIWWVNHWIPHPCTDLALPFEVGTRAYHHV